MAISKAPCSYKDLDGYVFYDKKAVYRSIAHSYQEHYTQLMNSGLYKELTTKKLLISHTVQEKLKVLKSFKVIKPFPIPLITYPYEWSFSQLQDAALCTIDILSIALRHGLILKDAHPFNIQFYENKPILIDTLSLTKYIPGQTWAAYEQFCTSFLGPLLLMNYCDQNSNKLLMQYPQGIPLDVINNLLPKKAIFNSLYLLHIRLHSILQNTQPLHYSKQKLFLNKETLLKLVLHLRTGIQQLTPAKTQSPWNNYHPETSYTSSAVRSKEKIIKELIADLQPQLLLDIGTNTGHYSKKIAQDCKQIVAIDNNNTSIDKLYQKCKQTAIRNIFPLSVDFTNSTPALGLDNKEFSGFWERIVPDTILALAVSHHLLLQKNISYEQQANILRKKCHQLIIEFIPPHDTQFKTMYTSSNKINASESDFEKAFSRFFICVQKKIISNSQRTIYLYKKRI